MAACWRLAHEREEPRMVLKGQGGKQVYSDGEETEQRMLAVAQAYPEDLSQNYIAKDSTYTVNNTFSAARQNILNWYPFKKDAQILEVGAGMGAITGMLCDRAAHVTALEMNRSRAGVIRARYPKRDNLEVVSGDIKEWQTCRTYDYVIFIGVLEYAAIFSDAEKPYVEFLKNAGRFLKEDGTLLFAIENRFGLKYWLGASEDHLQEPFAGLMGYKDKKGPRTFSRAELASLLEQSGFLHYRFYSVLPDYKFPELIFADSFQPDAMNLKKVSFTYAKNSTLAGDEKWLYQDLIANGVFPFFANSFLVEASARELADRYALHVSAKGEVYPQFRVSTAVFNDGYAYKIPMHRDAKAHLQAIVDNMEYLEKRGIAVLPYEYGQDGHVARCKLYSGTSAQQVFKAALAENDKVRLKELVECLRDCYLKSSEAAGADEHSIIEERSLGDQGIGYGLILQKAFIDMTFYNAFYENGKLLFYDQEWCLERVPLNFCLYYAMKSAYYRADVDTGISFAMLLHAAGIKEAETAAYERLEADIWSHILYRQTDFYGADGYCNRFDERMTVRAMQVQQQKEKEQLENSLKQAQGQLENSRHRIKEMEGQAREQARERAKVELALRRELADKTRQAESLLEAERSLKQELKNKQGHIELLLETEREFERVKKSRTWKLAFGLQQCSARLFPLGSARRLAVKMALRLLRHPKQSLKMLSPRKIRHFFQFLKEEGAGFVSQRIDESMQGVTVTQKELEIRQDVDEKPFSSYRTLVFPKAEEPDVSIMIPVYNEFPYTYRCLQSILEQSGDDVSYEVIIADDASTDDTKRLHEAVKNIRMIRNPHNLRFLKNCNHAAQAARGKYLLFLNNDTQVQENWLEPLVRLMEKDPSVGIAGAKLVYADGRLQEAGGIVWDDASAWNYGNRMDAAMPEYNYVKEADYISGAALLVRKALWEEIGGFDERFAPAYYEDTDLAFAARKRGYQVLYQPLSVVVHFEGVSNGKDVSAGQKAYQEKNRAKFYEKWKDILAGSHCPNGEHLFSARDRSVEKKTLLVVDHYVPTYDKDAGSRCIFDYLKLFVSAGYNVKFIGDNFYKSEPYTTVLQQMGIEVLYGDYYYQYWKSWIRKNGKYFDYVLLSRPHISVKYIDLIRECSHAKIIYFGHDLHFLREMREYRLTGNEQARRDAKEWKKTELALMRKADVSYYLSNAELMEIAKLDASIKVRRVPIHIYETMPKPGYCAKERQGLLFVGGFGHPPNTDAVQWLSREIMPLIWEKSPDVVLHIVGQNPPQEIRALAGKKVLVHGYVPQEELEELYSKVKLAVVPLRFGAGVKGKIIEAMLRGVPVVTTGIGIEGIEGAKKIVTVCEDAEGLAEMSVRLYEDEGLLEKMSVEEWRYIMEHFSVECAVKILKEDFELKI